MYISWRYNMSVDRVILSQQRVKWLGLVIAVKAPGSTEMGGFLEPTFLYQLSKKYSATKT
jgi:hypothetical protein